MFKGSLLGQIIGVFSTLFLAKLYGSEAFGIFGVFMSYSSILSIINTLQLEYGIITSTNKTESSIKLKAINYLVILITLIIIILFFLCVIFFNFSSKIIILLSCLSALIISWNKIFDFHLTSKKKFNIISKTKFLSPLFNFIFQSILYFYFNLNGLVYGYFLTILSLFFYFYFNKKTNFKIGNLKDIKYALSKDNLIIKQLFPSSLINIFAITYIPMLIAFYFTIDEYGVYFLSIKILGIPLYLVSSSFMQIYYQKSSELFITDKKKLFKFTLKSSSYIFIITLFLLILINTIGIYLLKLLLNKSWENLELYMLILSSLILAKTTFNTIGDIFVVLKKNFISLYLNIFLLIVNILAIWVGNYRNDILYTICIFSFAGSIGYFGTLFYSLTLLKNLAKIDLLYKK